MAERHNLEKFLGMSSGYVLNFSDRTFAEFVFEAVGIDIHDENTRRKERRRQRSSALSGSSNPTTPSASSSSP